MLDFTEKIELEETEAGGLGELVGMGSEEEWGNIVGGWLIGGKVLETDYT